MAQTVVSAKPKAKPRWQRRKDARPEELIAAALEVFVERGYAATKLEQVAERAGVTKGTIYLYFANKEALFKAVVRDSIVPALARGEEMAAAHSGSAADLFRQLVRAWWDVIGGTSLSGVPKLMMAEATNFPELARFYHKEVVTRGHRLMGSVIERGMANGEFRSVDVPIAVRLVMAPLIHAANWRSSFALCLREGFDVDAYLESHIDIFLRGIAKHPDRKA